MSQWCQKKFSDFAKLQKGISYKSEDYAKDDSGAVFLTIKCVSKSGGFKPEGIKHYAGPYTATDLLESNDLLIANTDLTRNGDIVGCPILVPDFGERNVLMSMDLSRVCLDLDQIDPHFFYYLIMNHEVRKFMKDHASGSTVLHLQTSAVPKLELYIPVNVNEQKHIGEILKAVDLAIDQTERLIAKQQRIKAGMIQDLLTNGIDENGQIRSEETHEFRETPLGRFPIEWDVGSAASLCHAVIDCKNRTPPVCKDGYPVIRTPNVRDGLFVYQDLLHTDPAAYEIWTARGKPKPGDVVITREAPFGEACRIPFDIREPCLGQRMMLYKPKQEVLDADFLVSMIYSERVQKLLFELAGGSTVGHIRVDDIKTLLIPHPRDVCEQKRISQVLESVNANRAESQKMLHKLVSIKYGLMSDLLTGKVHVPLNSKKIKPAVGAML